MIYHEFYKTFGIITPVSLSKTDRIKFNRYVFDNDFKPKMESCQNKKQYVELSSEDLEKINTFAALKVNAKTKEWRGVDDKNRIKRETTGACIEYGLLKLFKKEDQFDNSVVDKSYKKNHPDLLPLGVLCDIKGSSMNNVPLVFKENRTYTCNIGRYKGKKYRCSNVIGITDHKSVWILGIASPKILQECVDDNLIIMSENTTKTGFHGVRQLEDIPLEWEHFKQLCSEKSLIL